LNSYITEVFVLCWLKSSQPTKLTPSTFEHVFVTTCAEKKQEVSRISDNNPKLEVSNKMSSRAKNTDSLITNQ
jgi:hypothetical protein